MKNTQSFILTIFLLCIFIIGISFQKKEFNQTQKLYGNWEFQYLLLNGKSKIWRLNKDKSNFDYMNIHFIEKDIFDVAGTLVMKTGKFSIEKNYIHIKIENSIDDIIPKDNSTEYKKNIKWTRSFFNGKCFYSIENNSFLKLYKNIDSVLVFKRFK